MKLIKYLLTGFIALFITISAYAGHARAHYRYSDWYLMPPPSSLYMYVRGAVLMNQTEFINSIPTNRSRVGVQGDFGFIKNISSRWGFGAEFGVGYYGQATGYLVNVVNQFMQSTYFGFDVVGVAVYRVIPKFWIRARMGLAVFFAQPSTGSSELNQTNTNALIGFGIMYTITPNFSLTGDYAFVNGVGFIVNGGGGSSVTAISMPQFNLFMFGLEYRFRA